MDITVIISTVNRSAYLAKTLEAMTRVDRNGLDVQFVVVDNNSTDDTSKVIGSFADRLPLLHLFEPRPGKNCALNHALNTVEIGDIVVLTDDDVVPCKDWLKEIASACKRWPEYDAFGGRIELIWPDGVEIPRWASENVFIRETGFAEHDLGTEEKPYEQQHGSVPSGPNYWVRGVVFRRGVRFDESMWTRPGPQFCMGDEKELLLRLVAGGARLMYAPCAAVGHHVQISLLNPRNMLRRAIRDGRGGPHLVGLPNPGKLAKHPWRWRARRVLAMAWYLLKFLQTQVYRDECPRMNKRVEALRSYGYHREALSLSWGCRGRTECAGNDVPASEERA